MCAPETRPSTKSETAYTNERWILSQRPNGAFNPQTDVKLVAEPAHMSCQNDEVIVEVEMLSVDAFIRTTMDENAYHGSVAIGKTLPALGYGKIVHAGSASKMKVGAKVVGMLGAQKLAVVKASAVRAMTSVPFMPESSCLGLLGLTTGLTAYAGTFFASIPPRKGETVVVSAATGAVGSVAAQLAKTTGARVIGIAGGERKRKFLLEELKLDGAVDYKSSTKSVGAQLDELCPNGIDFFYDNVGGVILDDVMERINPKGRVVICGAISQYSGNLNHKKVQGPSNYLKLAEKGASMTGFNVMQYLKSILVAVFWMLWFYLRGQVTMVEHVEEGIHSFPAALEKMFTGGHIGKLLVDVGSSEKDENNSR